MLGDGLGANFSSVDPLNKELRRFPVRPFQSSQGGSVLTLHALGLLAKQLADIIQR